MPVVLKTHSLEQGAPWVVHEVFVPAAKYAHLRSSRLHTGANSAPTLYTLEHRLALLKVISLPEHPPDDLKDYRRPGFQVSTHSHLSEHQSVNQLGNRRTRELYDQTSSYLKNQRLVPNTKSRRVASQTSIPAPRTTPPPTTTTMVPRGLTNEEIEEDLVTMGLRLRTKKRKRSGAILPWH
ncbi:hypothetical protein D6D19_06385 [Aureobasidium pullulans]|uniref:Uncharacterized protein n=1 Tax=Aureobasidium pullulans TaxID=5580 RepID=A0A4V4IR58_AURPU|nr:hypothetical protein D6D19_06385 [Aureobasidium pullulans]